MRKRLVVVVIGLVLAMAMPSVAIGGAAFTLHPAGRGQQTYASWKANAGETDSGGMANQAIFMQKNSDQPLQAVVVVRGFAGEPVTSLQSLSWDMPTGGPGGTCDSWPRWQLSVNSASDSSPIQFGFCFSQVMSPGQEANWTRHTCAGTCLPTLSDPNATIGSLAIVFARPSPDFVLLDDITVAQSGFGAHTWTSASDNGTTAARLNIGPSIALADVVSDVLGDLVNLFPGVPANEWTLYPAVDLTPLPTAPTLP